MIIEAPNTVYNISNNLNKKLFLAGGIFGCKDWQSLVLNELKNIENLTIFNPKRNYFDVSQLNIQEEQIVWEYNHLELCDYISYWFSSETLNPITLFELGKYIKSNKKITIGIEDGYQRKNNIIIQTTLVRNDIKIAFNITDFINNIKTMLT
jgi:hypothetical protein